jgi:hypothetical protein
MDSDNNNKTLIESENYLFLVNDSAKELEVHCNNLMLVDKKKLSRYNNNLEKFLLIVFPNKSLIYKKYLPKNYDVKYRPGLDEYINCIGNKIIDTYDVLKNECDVYYKTDTHVNMKGAYIVYKYFIEKLNEIYNLNIKPKEINLSSKECVLSELGYGIGDLLWENNLGDQIVENKMDTFYYSEDNNYLYCKYVITKNGEIRILNKNLQDINEEIQGSVLSWDIISNNILYKKDNKCINKNKVIIFYDSFLLSTLSLYLELFEEIYMVKSIYDVNLINIIIPDYIFEFRVERFLL